MSQSSPLDTSARIGLVGLGIMGSQIALRLIVHGELVGPEGLVVQLGDACLGQRGSAE